MGMRNSYSRAKCPFPIFLLKPKSYSCSSYYACPPLVMSFYGYRKPQNVANITRQKIYLWLSELAKSFDHMVCYLGTRNSTQFAHQANRFGDAKLCPNFPFCPSKKVPVSGYFLIKPQENPFMVFFFNLPNKTNFTILRC